MRETKFIRFFNAESLSQVEAKRWVGVLQLIAEMV